MTVLEQKFGMLNILCIIFKIHIVSIQNSSLGIPNFCDKLAYLPKITHVIQLLAIYLR